MIVPTTASGATSPLPLVAANEQRLPDRAAPQHPLNIRYPTFAIGR